MLLEQKEYKKIIDKHKINIKVVEKAGTQIKHILQKSDPFKNNKCEDTECLPCKGDNNDRPTNCRKDGVVYHISCNKCPAMYIGETSRNANSRGKEHKNDYINRRENSIMLRHTKSCHPETVNNPPDYTMKV